MRADAGTVRALALITAGVFLLRAPSFFEPPWYTDEGIFAAVAHRVLEGGALYEDAWESKPPLFLYVYVATIKIFGASIFGLHLMATLSALGTHVTVFFIGLRFMSRTRALVATACCGLLLGVPFWEGTLALTEIFTVLPTALGVLVVLVWDGRARPKLGREDLLLVLAGGLFGVAFLLRQTSVAGVAAAGIWLVLRGRPWARAAALGGGGFALVVLPVAGAFQLSGDFRWFWDANVTFFFQYVPSGRELPFASRPVILLPFLITVAVLVWDRWKGAETRSWALPALWLALTLAGALLTGRPYPHYLIQMFPPLALLVAMSLPAARRPSLRLSPAHFLIAALIIEWFYVVVPMFRGNLLAMHYTRGPFYYLNFAGWVTGLRSQQAYDDFFDKRVKFTKSLQDALQDFDAEGKKVYIWGEYPWVYPLAGVEPTTRYMTSYYVLLLPHLDTGLAGTLDREKPAYIVVMSDAKPRLSPPSTVIDQRWENAMRGLDTVLQRDYQQVASVGRAQIYRRSAVQPAPVSGITMPSLEEMVR